VLLRWRVLDGRSAYSYEGGVKLARFQGNVHASSDRAGATLLFIILLVAVLLIAWWQLNPAGFADFWNNLSRAVPHNP
jgi:hypothetical protein